MNANPPPEKPPPEPLDARALRRRKLSGGLALLAFAALLGALCLPKRLLSLWSLSALALLCLAASLGAILLAYAEIRRLRRREIEARRKLTEAVLRRFASSASERPKEPRKEEGRPPRAEGKRPFDPPR